MHLNWVARNCSIFTSQSIRHLLKSVQSVLEYHLLVGSHRVTSFKHYFDLALIQIQSSKVIVDVRFLHLQMAGFDQQNRQLRRNCLILSFWTLVPLSFLLTDPFSSYIDLEVLSFDRSSDRIRPPWERSSQDPFHQLQFLTHVPPTPVITITSSGGVACVFPLPSNLDHLFMSRLA